MSGTRAALVDNDGNVTSVIIVDSAIGYTPPDGLTLAAVGSEPVGPGWTYAGGTFTPPPARSLTVDRVTIPADGTTVAVVTYTDTHDDAPASVVFTVNGATKTVTLTAAGNAVLDVASSTADDTITVTVDALPEASVTITVEA